MFEKTKLKLQKGKEWAINHKADFAYYGGCVVGAVATAIVMNYSHKKDVQETINKFPNEHRVLVRGQGASGKYTLTGGDIKIGELSDTMISQGIPGDYKVVGALVYTDKY